MMSIFYCKIVDGKYLSVSDILHFHHHCKLAWQPVLVSVQEQIGSSSLVFSGNFPWEHFGSSVLVHSGSFLLLSEQEHCCRTVEVLRYTLVYHIHLHIHHHHRHHYTSLHMWWNTVVHSWLSTVVHNLYYMTVHS